MHLPEALTHPPQWLRNIGITAACALAGAVMVLFVWESEYSWAFRRYPNDPAFYLDAWQPYWVVNVTAGAVGLLFMPVALWRHERRHSFDLPTGGPTPALLAGAVVTLTGFSVLSGMAAVVTLVSMMARRNALWTLVGTISFAAGMGIDWWITRDLPDTLPAGGQVFVLLAGLTLALVIGSVRAQLQEEQWRVAALARLNSADMTEREKAVQSAERARLARDMHDSLSHRLSLIAVYAGVLSHQRDLPQETVSEQAELIRTQAEEAVRDLRQMLHTLRVDDSPETSFTDVVTRARQAGQHITVDGDLAKLEVLTGTIRHTMYRFLQEGLTNARKHAAGEPVTVSVGKQGVSIANPNPHPPNGEPGVGLQGMSERARIVGATVRVDNADPFIVTLSLKGAVHGGARAVGR